MSEDEETPDEPQDQNQDQDEAQYRGQYEGQYGGQYGNRHRQQPPSVESVEQVEAVGKEEAKHSDSDSDADD